MNEEKQQRTAMTPENYTFQLLDYQKTDAGAFYVLEAEPQTKNKLLFRGRIWVDAKDFAITSSRESAGCQFFVVEVRTDFKRSYQKIGDLWLPESNASETKVRVFGTAVLTIENGEYAIRPADAPVTSLKEVTLNGQIAEVLGEGSVRTAFMVRFSPF